MKRLAILCAGLLLGACAIDETLEPPAELVDFEQRARFEQVWSASIGDLDADLRLGLEPASDGENVYVADHEGSVHAFRLGDGSRVWEYRTNEFRLWGESTAIPFSAGPAVDGGRVAVGSINGDVLMLDAATGEKLWQVNVDGELLAPPLLLTDIVVVRTTDGRVIALGARDGTQRWDTVREMPTLTIRGAPAPATDRLHVFAGFDNGKAVALQADTGAMVWEATIATPGGVTELEEIVDIDGDLLQFGNELYVTSYNGYCAALTVESGEILWRRELSSVLAPAAARDNVFVTDIDSVVHGFDRLSGATLWMQDALRARSLTAPAVLGDLVVVGDFEGYLHFLDADSGAMLARIEHDGEPLRAQPLVIGERLIVLGEDGDLAAYRRNDAMTAD